MCGWIIRDETDGYLVKSKLPSSDDNVDDPEPVEELIEESEQENPCETNNLEDEETDLDQENTEDHIQH